MVWLDVVLATPAHSALQATAGPALTYAHTEPLPAGSWVLVPLGKRTQLGVVWACHTQPPEGLDAERIKPIAHVLEAEHPLGDDWRQLMAFAARYYQRSLGEMAVSALPPALRDLTPEQWARKRSRWATPAKPVKSETAATPHTTPLPATPEQAAALAALAEPDARPTLLFGATGSGKTEVYMQHAQRVLDADPAAQVLVMVPEINLTPQLETRFAQRFAEHSVVTLHSGLTPAQRLNHWWAAHTGAARIVLGTRLSVLASLPGLRLIVVDEEHDPSYKSQDGARFSGRDLAIYRAKQLGIGVVLGSATPSLETWHACEQGRYRRLAMPSRMGDSALPHLRLVDMHHAPKGATLAPALLAAMGERIAKGEQCMVLLNRRGYAPVLTCHECGWKSDCPHCSAHMVFHKLDRTLRCHHCSHTVRVPQACPECGNLDVAPIGRGTEQIEEQLQALLVDVRRPDGQPPKVLRIDADSTRHQGALEQHLAQVHSGEADVLVGTQMVAKGHDFRRITLVASLNTDSGLFASDHRAPERLFALLMQAGGRAGRDAEFLKTQASRAELWVQTWYPEHALFAALKTHDFPAFARQQLDERATAHMPPHSCQALLRAEAKTWPAAQAFCREAATAAAQVPGHDGVFVYPPVPAVVQRVANVERAQMLIEADNRAALQRFLQGWQAHLHAARQHPDCAGLIRWALDVDPLGL